MKNLLIVLLFATALFSQTLQIKEGWQLLGTDAKLDVSAFDGSACVELVWAYKGSEWQVYVAGAETYDTQDFKTISSIDANSGFWVYSKGQCELTTTAGSTSTDTTFSIESGWQLIGSAKDINASAFDGTCVDYIASYDNKKWSYHVSNSESYDTSAYTKLTTIKQNSGFWVKGNGSCSVTVTGSTQEKEDNRGPLLDLGNIVTSDGSTSKAKLAGGVSIVDQNWTLNGTYSSADTIDIKAIITLNPEDVGKEIDIVILIGYVSTSVVNSHFMKDTEGVWKPWDGVAGSVVAAEEISSAKETHTIDVLSSSSSPVGSYSVYIGYRINDVINYNATPIKFTVQ